MCLMPDRIQLDPAAIDRMIRSAALEDLRLDTPPGERERSIGRGRTALDALCGLADRDGLDEVWDVLAALPRRQLITFATFAVGELAETDYVMRTAD